MPVYRVPRNWASSRKPANDCNRARDARRSASTRSSCSTRLSRATAGSLSDPSRGFAADRRERLLEVDSSASPITGGHGRRGRCRRASALLAATSASRCSSRASMLTLPRLPLFRQCNVELGLQHAVVPDDEEHDAQCRQRDHAHKCHGQRPAFAPFPGAFPRRRRPGVNRVAIDEAAQVVRQLDGAGESPRRAPSPDISGKSSPGRAEPAARAAAAGPALARSPGGSCRSDCRP